MNKTHEPSWLAQAVFYEIYPASFRDSNGDGIGDIAGMVSQLDYLRRLGVNALWINPWYVSSFRDGGYDITDFMRPDPRYGALAEARIFFREAHRHGIRVVLDLVAGHTSLEHPYFQESCRGTGSRHQDFYIWNPNSVYRGTAEQYYIAGLFPRGSYCANFFASQPAINYGFNKVENPWEMSCDHPVCRANREWLISVMRYWLDLGCDGFRVDMASSIIKRDPGFEKTSQFWQSVRTIFDREYPEAVLLAEWFMPERSLAAGFHLDFVPPSGLFRNDSWSSPQIFSGEILFSAATKGNDGKWLSGYRKLCDVCNPAGLCLFSGTHDQWRLSYFGSDRETMVKLAFMTALPAPPFFYYGDEIGMQGYRDPFNRRPFPWGQEDKELQAHFRRLGQLRKRYEAFRLGDIHFCKAQDKHLGFTRSYRGKTFHVYCNRSGDAWEIPFGRPIFGYNLQILAPDCLTIGPRGFCVTEG